MKYFLLFLFFTAVYLIPLGGRPLVAPDEFRYAQIPLEMLESGNWAAPQMFGLPYFEKPALGHWMTAVNLKLFGCNAFAIRLAAALSVGLTALIVGLTVLSALHDKRLAMLSVMMFLCCGMVYGLGVFAVLDSPMALFSAGAMACAFGYLQKNTPRMRKIIMLILCGVFCGLGFMTKGAPALVVVGLGVVGFLIWERRWKEFFIMPWLPLVCAILTVLPWAVAVHRADADFWRYFWVVEHWQRFTGGAEGQHPEPWYFLLPFFFGGAFPAAFLLLPGWGQFRSVLRKMCQQELYRYMLCCAVLPLILFSCSSGKLPTYILPCFPAIAILMAGFTATALRSSEKSENILHCFFDILGWSIAVAGILAVPVGILLQSKLQLPVELPEKLLYTAPLLLAGGAACAASGTLLLLSRKKTLRSRLCFCALLFAIPALVLPFFIDWKLNPDKMPQGVLRKMQTATRVRSDDVHIVTIPSLMHAAAWHFHTKDVQLINSIGEMEYGEMRAIRDGKRRMRLDREALIRLVKNPDRKDVLYIHWSDRRPVVVPGIEPAVIFHDPAISARLYPGKRKTGKEKLHR